jgi:hypothetical protein
LLNCFIHKIFYKYLLSKYSSKPKVYTYIKKNFIVRSHFTSSEEKTLLNIKNIRPHGGRPLPQIVLSVLQLTSNLYLNKELLQEIKGRIKFAAAYNKLNYRNPLSKQEIVWLLCENQDYMCSICAERITPNRHSIELDHKPPMYELVQKLWKLAVESALKSLKVDNKKSENADIYIAHFEFLREDETFLSKAFKDIYNIYVTHKGCNQKKGKQLQTKALRQAKSIIKKLNPKMFDYYKNFTKQLKTDIKKQKTLSDY